MANPRKNRQVDKIDMGGRNAETREAAQNIKPDSTMLLFRPIYLAKIPERRAPITPPVAMIEE
jgi:hypothetical protein